MMTKRSNMPARLLVVDRDTRYGEWLRHHLGVLCPDATVSVLNLSDFERWSEELSGRDCDVMMLSAPFGSSPEDPQAQGLELLRQLRDKPHFPAVIAVAEEGNELTAVRALQLGAVDYLPKRLLTPERLKTSVKLALRLIEKRVARRIATLAAAAESAGAESSSDTIARGTSTLNVVVASMPDAKTDSESAGGSEEKSGSDVTPASDANVGTEARTSSSSEAISESAVNESAERKLGAAVGGGPAAQVRDTAELPGIAEAQARDVVEAGAAGAQAVAEVPVVADAPTVAEARAVADAQRRGREGKSDAGRNGGSEGKADIDSQPVGTAAKGDADMRRPRGGTSANNRGNGSAGTGRDAVSVPNAAPPRKLVERLPQSLAAATGPGGEFMPADFLPGYTIHATIGESEKAAVYVATSLPLKKNVALKVSKTLRDEAAGRQFLEREYTAIVAIRNPSVVQIYDYGVHAGYEYLVMEYLPRGDLKARMQHGLSDEEALSYLLLTASALQVVHDAGLLHRDLKPPYVMLRDNGDVALIDFGLARALDGSTPSTRVGVLRGSPYYMSLEQALGEILDARSDFYSLGIMFYEMLTGRKPYMGGSAMDVLQQHVNAPLPQLPKALAQYEPLLLKLLAKSREQRFASASELIGAIAQMRGKAARAEARGTVATESSAA
jgi:DNA-binding response OmpR family regulator